MLTGLQTDIKARQESIQRLKTFNRSCQVHLVLFSSFFYAGYSVYLFLQYKFLTSNITRASLSFIILFPIGVFYTKKLASALLQSIIARKQVALKAKQAQLKDRIEEIKVETRYYQTKDLIEKYDKESSGSVNSVKDSPTELKRRSVNASITSANTTTGVSTNSSVTTLSNPSNKQRSSPQSSQPPRSPPQIQMSPPRRQHPPTPTWMDRFMDALIGDDSRNQKYALICAQCFNHNGLATAEAFESVRYRCPNCGFFNQMQMKRTASIQESPSIKEILEEKDSPDISESIKAIEKAYDVSAKKKSK